MVSDVAAAFTVSSTAGSGTEWASSAEDGMARIPMPPTNRTRAARKAAARQCRKTRRGLGFSKFWVMDLSVSAEGECIGLHAGIEEFDLEAAVGDRTALPHELAHPLTPDDAIALGVDIGAMAVARRLAVDRHAKADRLAVRCGAEDEMQVAGMEAIDDAPIPSVEGGMLPADPPIPAERPFVGPRSLHRIDVRPVL